MNHDCSRFIIRRIGCPFRDMKHGEDEPPDDEVIPFPVAFPARKADERKIDNITRLSTVAVAEPELRKALERMAAFQREGALQSIPNLEAFEGFNLPGFARPEIIAVLTAIAIAAGLKGLRSNTMRSGFRAVQTAELRAAEGLSKLGERFQGPGRTQGRGGFHVNEAARLRGLLGFKRKLTGEFSLAFGQEFSETGF